VIAPALLSTAIGTISAPRSETESRRLQRRVTRRKKQRVTRAGNVEPGALFQHEIAADRDRPAGQHAAGAEAARIEREERAAGGGENRFSTDVDSRECDGAIGQEQRAGILAAADRNGAAGRGDRAEHEDRLAFQGDAAERVSRDLRAGPHDDIAADRQQFRELIGHAARAKAGADRRARPFGFHDGDEAHPLARDLLRHGDQALRNGRDLRAWRDEHRRDESIVPRRRRAESIQRE
jgi:hypothetical protein